MEHLVYLGLLAACLLGTAPLEVLLGTRVYARWRRLGLTLLCVAPVFVAWDLYAIHAGQWTFDPARIVYARLPGGLPLEELLFFLVVPVCAVLTLEAVRAVRGWPVGDESPGRDGSPAGTEPAGTASVGTASVGVERAGDEPVGGDDGETP
jgi:lycopene cyclase domain-containing protein